MNKKHPAVTVESNKPKNKKEDLDIFIDNCVAIHFNTPADPHYKDFINWLREHGSMVVSNKLLVEYQRTLGFAQHTQQLLLIIYQLAQDSRLKKISNKELKKHGLKAHQLKKFISNQEDHHHIFLLIKSKRHMGLSVDNNLIKDVKKVPGYEIVVEKKPNKLKYKAP